MANHTISLVAKDENALTDATAAYNAPLLLQVPPGVTLTNDQYLQQIIVAPAIASMRAIASAANIGNLHTRLQAAGDAGDRQTLNKVGVDLTSGGYP